LIRPFLSILLVAGCACWLSAQESRPYKGLRIAVFNFEVIKASEHLMLLRCDMANTGRYALQMDKNNPPPAALLVEMDTARMPDVLLGREANLVAAISRQRIKLLPGEIRTGLVLKIKLSPAPSSTAPSAATSLHSEPAGCGDLVFDTVYIGARDDKFATIHYTLRNSGAGALSLSGKPRRPSERIVLNVYFVRESKLTRGALLAGGDVLEPAKNRDNSLLLPGDAISGEIEISLLDRTAFAPNLMLEINPFQAVQECRYSNNFWLLVPDF